jgi:predicted PurR-regulated permease PerM
MTNEYKKEIANDILIGFGILLITAMLLGLISLLSYFPTIFLPVAIALILIPVIWAVYIKWIK